MAVYLVTLDSDPRSSAHRLVHYDTLSLNHHLYADDIQLSFFFIICFFTRTLLVSRMLYNRPLPGYLLVS